MAFLHHPRILRTTTTTGDDEIPSPFPSPRPATFRPTITVIVVVLTTFFSCTFLLLLYAKHCKRRHGSGGGGGGVLPSTDGCRNSGVARTVVESLPAFRFGSLKGQKEGLECAVCLNRFEPDEVLRLLPKCKHAFHVECIDVWLDAHSTCPLCRLRVHPEDLLLLHREPIPDPIPETETETETKPEPVTLPRRISGRHSSAGEQCSRNSLIQVVVHKTDAQSGNVTAPLARGRKDGLLVTESPADREGFERRFSHQIIVSGSGEPDRGERWTEPRPSLFLRSDCLISGGGRSVNTGLRSVSEITGLSRFKLRLSGRDKRQNLSLNGQK